MKYREAEKVFRNVSYNTKYDIHVNTGDISR